MKYKSIAYKNKNKQSLEDISTDKQIPGHDCFYRFPC